MKTSFEKGDASKFRKFVRETRFSQRKFKSSLQQFISRLDKVDEPPIALFIAKSLQSDGTTPFDTVGIGKTDFTYFSANFFREANQQTLVLAFPDIFDEIVTGSTFYNSVFVPEVMRLTQKRLDRLKSFGYSLRIGLISLVSRFFLLLRVNVILTVTVLAFVLGAISIGDIFEHQSELISLISKIATPIVLAVVIVGWLLVVWEKIKDGKYSNEWEESSVARLKQLSSLATSNISPEQLLERFPANKTTIIIIDDASRIDAESLNNIIKLVTIKTKKANSHNHPKRTGLVLISDPLDKTSESETINQQLSEYRCRKNNWYCFDINPPTLDEIEWLLCGFDQTGKAWNSIKQLVNNQTDLQNNTGFLLQFLYDEMTVLENQESSLANIEFSKLVYDFQSFSKDYNLQAERIISRIPNEISTPAKALLKYILAFESPIKNIEVINTALTSDGYPNIKEVVDKLIEENIIKLSDGGYCFEKSSEKNTLSLNWAEWLQDSQYYYTKIFNSIHDKYQDSLAYKSFVDNPNMAKKCTPSHLVVDTLWREGDASWFYGGNSDSQSALSYYGIEHGALSKWYRMLSDDVKVGNISDRNFYWRVEAKNSPYRYTPTSRSVRSDGFIGGLIQVTASLYFSAGDYRKSYYILKDLWREIKNICWNSPRVSDNIKARIKDADVKIRLQLAEYLTNGPARKENLDLAQEMMTEILSEKVSADIEFQVQVLIDRISYFSKFGIGNLPSSLSLIRDIQPEKSLPNKNVRSILPELLRAPIYISHICDYIHWGTANSSQRFDLSKSLEEMEFALEKLEKDIKLFEKRIDDTQRKTYPLADYFPYPIADAEVAILLLKGWCNYFKGDTLYYEYIPKIEQIKTSFNILELGVSIRRYYEISENMWNKFDPEKRGLVISQNLRESRKSVSDLYGKYLSSDNPKRNELQEISSKILQSVKTGLKELQKAYFGEALKIFKLASNLSSIRLQKHNEILADYNQIMVLLDLMSINRQPADNQYLEWFFDLLGGIEFQTQEYVLGGMLESLRTHVQIAQAFGESQYEESYKHYEKAGFICNSIEGYLPSILKGAIVGRQLNLIGNMSAFVRPDQIMSLANQALKIYNEYSGDGVRQEDLEVYKGSARWWIAEACARLAATDIDNIDAHYANAKHHFNWINRQAKDNLELRKGYVPKIKQVQGEFFALQKDYKKAIAYAQEALTEFGDNLFEQIQTLGSIVSYYMSQDKNLEGFSGTVSSLRVKLLQSRGLIEKEKLRGGLHRKTSEVCILYGKTIWRTTARDEENMASEAVDLWFFGISGLLDWGLAGRAAIELSYVKRLSDQVSLLKLPLTYESLIRRCVKEWNPLRELTDKVSVEKALSFLVGKNVELSETLPETSSKLDAIKQAQILLAHSKPETQKAYDVLKNSLGLVDAENPTSEDIDLMRLLVECCTKEEDFEKVKEYNILSKRITNTFTSRVYLEIAKAFTDANEIRERYLHMAATTNTNKYSEEANRMIFEILNKEGIRKSDLIKDDLEKITFDRLINLPDDDYDVSEAFNLLFLFENELRRLIAHHFNQRSGWWKKGIPSDLYEKPGKEGDEHTTGIDLLKRLTLGDLFRIIQFGENWEQVFKSIFLSNKYIDSRATIIVDARNKIAHTNPDITDHELHAFVAVAKHMITIIQPFLPE